MWSIGDCAKTLNVAIADGDALTSPKRIQFFSIPFDSTRRSWTGTYKGSVLLLSGSSGSTRTTTTMLNATVDIVAADDPYSVDGGMADTSEPTSRRSGAPVHGSSADWHVRREVSVHYCNWGLCI